MIDGKAIAQELKEKLKHSVDALIQHRGIQPKLAVILVGDDRASQIYVRNKKIVAEKIGILSEDYILSKSCTEQQLLQTIDRCNQNPAVHGILLQLPLPKSLNETKILERIHPQKDVDCFHHENAGWLALGKHQVAPCTPTGCLYLMKTVAKTLEGLHAVVVGRSNIVGKPMAQLLLQENCTVTIAHSKTKNLEQITRQAQILVSAVGQPNLITASHVAEGAIVIDVGIYRHPEQKTIAGDVDFEAVKAKAKAISPVPGGVGPMTIAFLMANTVKRAAHQTGTPLSVLPGFPSGA